MWPFSKIKELEEDILSMELEVKKIKALVNKMSKYPMQHARIMDALKSGKSAEEIAIWINIIKQDD